MRWRLFYVALFFQLSISLSAQKPSADSLRYDTIVKKAVDCLKRGKADSSALLHKQALDFFAGKNYWIAWMKSYVSIANAWADVQQPYLGLETLEKALNTCPNKPQTAPEWEQQSLVYLTRGFIYEDKIGDFHSAKTEYEKSYQIFQKQLGGRSDRLAGYLFWKYGNLCTRLGDYEKAINLHQRCIDYGKTYNLPLIAKYGDLALALLDLNKNNEALKAVAEGIAHQGSSSETLITLRRSEARAHLNLGDRKKAREALALIPRLIGNLAIEGTKTGEDYYWSGYYELVAALEESSGNYKNAIVNLRRAIEYETKSWQTPYRREVGKLHCAVGELYMKQNQPAEAMKQYQTALTCVLPAFKPATSTENPPKSMFEAENTILEALEGKARAFRAIGQLEPALECYELIPVIETMLRSTYAYESSSLFSLNESRLRFDQAILVAWQLFESKNGDINYARRAFRLTEQARGMILLQSLAEAQAKFHLPEDVRFREDQLRGKMSWYDQEIAAERKAGADGDPERLKRLEKELLDLKQENEAFKTELRSRFPEYARLSEEIRFLEAGDVASLLHKDQVLVDYYLTDGYAFVFSFDANGGFFWRRVTLPASFRETVQKWVEYLQKGDEEDKPGAVMFKGVAYQLYEQLLKDELARLLPNTGSLIVIPDDALVFVPFDVLLRRPGGEQTWNSLPWLLADYNTGYAYSATLLHMQQEIGRFHRERQSKTRYRLGGFAPSYTAEGIYQLTSTQDLVKSVKQMLGGEIWTGTDASEEQFKKTASGYQVLLLAMHGIADAEHPELSKLLFGDPGVDTLENNNVLYTGELQIMQLQADLAVLSACHSGFGKLQKGEGVYSLARAFARAGVPATVMSLWLLSENTAGPLMEGFFKYLKAGKTKDEALRLAKLDLLHNNKYFSLQHPFYWAGLAASGDMCALDLNSGFSFRWWWLLALLAPFMWWFWMKRRNKAALQ